jgi:NAD(P)-dependent dehydrogenase (short-subunit alcohol dehydrogenase family)
MGVVMITGASAGIGAAAAVELTRQGHQVLATGRSPAKLAAVHRRMVAAAAGQVTVPEPEVADLADLAQVRQLARVILDRFPVLDVLVNNAGVQPSRRSLSVDGIELALAVNHVAHFALSLLLADRLQASGGRVVTTSSSNHAKAEFDFSDLQLERGWTTGRAYGRSKLANIWFTTEFRRRTGIPASAFHPGTISTDLNRDAPFVRIIKPLEKLVMRSPEVGADTLVWLAVEPEGGAPGATYYAGRAPAETSAAAQDGAAAERLWEVSDQMVGRPSRGPFN